MLPTRRADYNKNKTCCHVGIYGQCCTITAFAHVYFQKSRIACILVQALFIFSPPQLEAKIRTRRSPEQLCKWILECRHERESTCYAQVTYWLYCLQNELKIVNISIIIYQWLVLCREKVVCCWKSQNSRSITITKLEIIALVSRNKCSTVLHRESIQQQISTISVQYKE